MEKIIMHIDVNSAFLSWTAVDLLKNGYKKDIRCECSVIGGDESKRKGIVLAKSVNWSDNSGKIIPNIIPIIIKNNKYTIKVDNFLLRFFLVKYVTIGSNNHATTNPINNGEIMLINILKKFNNFHSFKSIVIAYIPSTINNI